MGVAEAGTGANDARLVVALADIDVARVSQVAGVVTGGMAVARMVAAAVAGKIAGRFADWVAGESEERLLVAGSVWGFAEVMDSVADAGDGLGGDGIMIEREDVLAGEVLGVWGAGSSLMVPAFAIELADDRRSAWEVCETMGARPGGAAHLLLEIA